MAPDRLQAVCQSTRICGNPSTCFFATQNRVISANVSFRQFAASDEVISPVQIWAKLPINVQSTLPAHFRVFAARSWVKPYAAHLWVTLYDTHLRVPAHLWVNSFVSYSGVTMYDTCLWMPAHSHVNLYAAYLQVNLYVVQPWVGLYDCLYAACPEVKPYVAPLWVNLHLPVNQTTHLWVNMYYIFKWVDQCASCEWEKQYAHWVNNKQNILLACFNMCNLLHF